ncbi:MAG: rRNA maturation RNase YbeY, partial [Phormidesmis sp.]
MSIKIEAFVEGSALLADSVKPNNLLNGLIDDLSADAYQSWLYTWLDELDPQLSPIDAYEVSLRLTDDSEIQQLNTDYRQQAKP